MVSQATLELLQQHGCGNGADLVLACHNAAGCEGTTVLATKPFGPVRVFQLEFALKDGIGSHACSLEVNIRVAKSKPHRSSLLTS